MSNVTHLDASAARTMFPFVVGPVNGADLWSGFAILDMGVGAYGVVVAGKFVACSPDYTAAKVNGELHARIADAERGPKIPKAVIAFALKHKISVGAVHAANHSGFDYYYIVNASGRRCITTQSQRPTGKQALAMCKRYLANRAVYESGALASKL